MAERITTNHEGYDIVYWDESNEWHCLEIDFRAGSLKAVKDRIDTVLRSLRRSEAVSCYEVNWDHHTGVLDVVEGLVVEYIGEVIERHRSTGERGVVDHTVAITATRRGRNRPGRTERRLSTVVKFGPATEEAIEVMREAGARLHEAQKAFNRAREALPRLSFEDVAALAKIGGR